MDRCSVNTWDVYVSFRSAQADFNNRGFRLPKDWDKHFAKMSKVNQESLLETAGNFNTIWQNININKFMRIGFELYKKTFSYAKFDKENLIKLYIEKDKQEKRSIRVNKAKIIESAKYIKNRMKAVEVLNGYNTLQVYCKQRNGGSKWVIDDYLQGDVDNYMMTYLVHEKYIILDDEERERLTYIVGRYREFVERMEKIRPFIKKVELEI